jgi:hypothetical protein
MTSRPVLVPGVVGMKTTITAQRVFGATALPQLLVWLKSLLVVMLSIRLDAMPVALSVTVCGELAVPTLWFPKVNSNVEGVSIALGGHGTKPPQPPQQTSEDTRIATLRHKVTLLKSLGQEQQSSGGREFVQLGSNHLSTFGTNRNDDRASYFQGTLSVGRMGLGKIGHGCGLCHPSPKALPDYLWAWPTEWRPRSTYFPTGFCGA